MLCRLKLIIIKHGINIINDNAFITKTNLRMMIDSYLIFKFVL